MIWDWINAVAVFLKRLVMPPVPPPYIPKIDPNEVCPGCGNTNGSLLAEPQPDGRMLIRHRCNVCGMKWRVKPVLHEPVAVSSATVKLTADIPKE